MHIISYQLRNAAELMTVNYEISPAVKMAVETLNYSEKDMFNKKVALFVVSRRFYIIVSTSI